MGPLTVNGLLDTCLNPLGYFRKKPAFVNVFGHKMFQNPADDGINYQGQENVSMDRFRYGEIAIVKDVKAGETVLDIGANIGFFTLLYARQVGPNGRVFAFEPGPQSFALLTKNVAINQYKNVSAVNKAVAQQKGMTHFFLCRTGESDNRLFDTPQEERDVVDIETVALDEFLNDTKVDFIKMDIQGAEYVALEGMSDLLTRNQHVRVLLEYSPLCLEQSGVNLKEFLNYIHSLKFKIHVLFDDKPMEPVTDQWLLDNCGVGRTFPHVNLLLLR
jgi:FkbM family methyltransferase